MKGRHLLMIVLGMLMSMACTFNTLLPAQAPTDAPAASDVTVVNGQAQSVQAQNVQIQAQNVQVQAQNVQVQSGYSGNTANTTYYGWGCTPRYDWTYGYVIQPGETLSNIAWRAGVSVDALAQGNCIANPNTIYAGQTLRLPRPIAAPPPHYPPPYNPPPHYPPPSGGWQQVGSVIPNPFLSLNGSQYQLQGGAVVGLSWAINAYGVTRVEFYFTPNGGQTILIGTDTYFGDGTAIAWGVPQGSAGSLSASAFTGSGLVKTTAYYTYVYANNPQPPTQAPPPPPVVVGSGLSISPFDSVNNNTFILPPDQLITISWPATFPTATDRVVFQLIPPGGGTPQAIGLDTNLADGASILWNSVNGTQGTLQAVAYFQGGYAPQASDSYYIIAGAP